MTRRSLGNPGVGKLRFHILEQAAEDPVTGSLNASLAQWLLGEGVVSAPYVAAQGSCLGRAGRVYVDVEGDDIWIGGRAPIVVDGTVTL